MTRRSAIIAFLAFAPLGADDPKAGAFNEQVVAFARENLGERVGDGDCTDLVVAALRHAGARTLERPGPDGAYVWGEVVKSPKDARPGDILQFEKATFRGRRRVVNEDGSPGLVTTTVRFPHHSAIISAVGAKGRTLTILQQNNAHPDGSNPRVVEEATIAPAQMLKGGSMVIYRPVAP